MTREDAILHMTLRREELKNSVSDLNEDIKAFDMAIKALEQEPFINKPCVSEKVCEHDKHVVLGKIRAEIDRARFVDKDTMICKNALASGLEVAMQIIDKYAESEDKHEK